MRQTQLANPEEGLALAPSGWHPVRASFEVDKVTQEAAVEGVCVIILIFPDLVSVHTYVYAVFQLFGATYCILHILDSFIASTVS